MDLKVQKPFENPSPDVYLGTIIDVVSKPQVPSTYNGVTTLQDKIVIVWVLNYLNGAPALNSENKPFTVRETHNASMHENANLFKRIQQILGQAPPAIKNDEEVAQLLIGRSAQLYLISNPNPKKPESPFININGSAPIKPGQYPPAIPQGYVRVKFRPPKTFGQSGQQAQAAQPAYNAPAPVAQPAPAAAPQPATQSPVAPNPNNTVEF